ncbi:MAG TPA: ribose-5-phosphate isomerase RpiA [Thermoanaerobaculia bacterium]|nr:ribose-5-phosphate isomerase RpiA [Thermoanaerobaculia bacterium]
MAQNEMKIEAARTALAEVRAGMKLGLGTGTTSVEFVKLLAASPFAREVRCTCTSQATEDLARSLGIPLATLDELAPLDLAIDGADEIDAQLRLIKGRGGALLREKIVEQQAARFIVIADESKLVDRLGVGVLPVEVTPFALEVLMRRFTKMRLHPELRMHEGAPRVTDEGHRIIDVRIPWGNDIAVVVDKIRECAGVVETGFFASEATEAIIAGANGIERLRR